LSIASANNDHRLGANEAPPAIISVFLGDQLQDIFDQLEKGPPRAASRAGMFVTGVSVLPPLPKEAGDRNRTSPFAFTGNKFEFRAVGSSANIAGPNTVLNTIVAESLDFIATKLEADVKGGKDLNKAIQELLPGIVKESKKVIFNGNGYSEEWHRSREARPAESQEHDRCAAGGDPQGHDRVVHQVQGLHRKGTQSRFNILSENYVKQVTIEAKTALMMAKTIILPAALKYQKEVGESVAAAKAAGASTPAGVETLSAVVSTINDLSRGITELEKAEHHHGDGDAFATPSTSRSRCCPRCWSSQGGRQAGNASSRRPLAAADVSGNAVVGVSARTFFQHHVGGDSLGFAFEIQDHAVPHGGDGDFLDVLEADVETAIEQRANLAGQRDGLGGARAGADAQELVDHRDGEHALRVRRQHAADGIILHMRGDDHALDQLLMLHDAGPSSTGLMSVL
jgi:hypothetical protein